MVQTGAGIYCSPAVEKDKVFVGCQLSHIVSYEHFIFFYGGRAVNACARLHHPLPVSYTHL